MQRPIGSFANGLPRCSYSPAIGGNSSGARSQAVGGQDALDGGPGDNVVLRAADRMSGVWDALDVLLLGVLLDRRFHL